MLVAVHPHPNDANAARSARSSAVLVQQLETSERPDNVESDSQAEWSSENLRYTRFGWRDPSDWQRAESYKIEYGINRVHPLLIGVEMLLLVAGAMIWASDEWELSRAFGERE